MRFGINYWTLFIYWILFQSTVLANVILSVPMSVRPSVCLSDTVITASKQRRWKLNVIIELFSL